MTVHSKVNFDLNISLSETASKTQHSIHEMAFGMYSCWRCAEYVIGSTVELQEFIAEHMCESTDEAMKAHRLTEFKVILEQIMPEIPSKLLQRPGESIFSAF